MVEMQIVTLRNLSVEHPALVASFDAVRPTEWATQ
jgi:hypothetical protein